MGDGVTTIGKYVFYNCSGLETIRLSSNLTSIGKYAFYGCGDFVIKCNIGTYAEEYAVSNEIPYITE
jgi:hypothetical protein